MSAKKETKEKTPAQKAAETRKRNAAKKLASQNEPEMVSYGMKMTIPTGQYANIQPEIVVKAGSPEEAHKYIAPHMNKLWKEYFMISERKTDVAKAPVTKAPVTKAPVKAEKKDPVEELVEKNTETSPVSDVALVKATQAIQSCMSTDALDLIIRQIGVSVKLTEEHKKSLLPIVEAKSKELNGSKE